MAVYLSPGVYPQEKDFSTYVKSLATSVFGIVGVFEKGEIDTPVFVTENDYKEKFGDTLQDHDGMVALEDFFLNGGSQAYVVRVTGREPETGKSLATKSTTELVDSEGTPVIRVEAKTEGSWGNDLAISVIPKEDKYTIVVKDKSDTVETLEDVEIISCAGVESDYITLTNVSENPEGVVIEPVTDQVLSGGDDGLTSINELDYIGDKTNKTGLWALNSVDNLNIIAIPGIIGGDIVDGLTMFCESRKDCMFITETPKGLTPQQAVDYRTGKSEYSEKAFNTTYGALYYPWLKSKDRVTKADRVKPPTGAVAGRYAYNDVVANVWNAPAGFQDTMNIGVLNNVTGLERNLDKAEMDLVYPEQINPIVNFTDGGIVIWGQKTLTPVGSAVDRVNVRRLLMYVSKAVSDSARFFVFKPNEKSTWNAFIRTVNPFMQDLKDKRAFYDYLVVCDETTNKPVTIDRNEMHSKIYVKPTKTAEFIGLDFIMTSTGTDFSEI